MFWSIMERSRKVLLLITVIYFQLLNEYLEDQPWSTAILHVEMTKKMSVKIYTEVLVFWYSVSL